MASNATHVRDRAEAKAEGFEKPSKADLFIAAYFEHNFNGTQAAMEVFDIDPDLTEEKRRATAATIAYEYLRKPEIRQKLKDRMERSDISLEYILEKLKGIADDPEATHDAKFRAIDRLAHFLGADIKESRGATVNARDSGVSIYLGLPQPNIQPQAIPAHVSRIIDATPNIGLPKPKDE